MSIKKYATEIGTKELEIDNPVINTSLNTKAREIENKIPDVTNLANKVDLNTKATEIKNKTPDTFKFIKVREINKLSKINLNPIQDGLFRDCSRMGGEQKLCYIYLILMKLDTFIPYLKKIQKST